MQVLDSQGKALRCPFFAHPGTQLFRPALDNHVDNFGQALYGRAKCLICKAAPCIAQKEGSGAFH